MRTLSIHFSPKYGYATLIQQRKKGNPEFLDHLKTPITEDYLTCLQIIKHHFHRYHRVIYGLPYKKTKQQQLTLDRALSSAEIQQYLSKKITQYNFDFISTQHQQTQTVDITCTDKKLIQQTLALFYKAKIHPQVIDVDMFGLGRLAQFTTRPCGQKHLCLPVISFIKNNLMIKNLKSPPRSIHQLISLGLALWR